jgi:asparagine synthase (glutamine-hydrolysing)
MGGICGIIRFDGSPVDRRVLERMAQAASHRGPDGVSYWIDGEAGLAYLALDLAPASAGGLCEEPASRAVLCSDARIDNRTEIAERLCAEGVPDAVRDSDPELISFGHRCWGLDLPALLVGDFAYALWDREQRRLYLARDPMGMRPLYYRADGRQILFASELKQILAVPEVPVRLREPAVAIYLAGGTPPLDWTFYEGIAQLPPGCLLAADERGHRLTRFWEATPDRPVRYTKDSDYAEHFLEIFKAAVRSRLQCLKPVGVLLSGGMDSGSIASTGGWMLERERAGLQPQFRAYSFAFTRLSECDERHISRGIVDHYRLPATDISADEAWPLKDDPAHTPDRDEPFIGHYQALYEHTLAVAQQHGVGLMMSGDRGDLIAGDSVYDPLGLFISGNWRLFWNECELLRKRDWPLHRVIRACLLTPIISTVWMEGGLHRLGRPLRRRLRRREPPAVWPGWIPAAFADAVGLADLMREPRTAPPVRGFARRRRYDLIFSPQHMHGAVWSERTQARFAQGFADPWSDLRIARFVLSIPQWIVQRRGEPKRLVRLAMRGVMPDPVLRTATKIYPLPFFTWAIREKERDKVLSLTQNSHSARRGFLDEAVFRRQYDAFSRGEAGANDFWSVLTLEMWLRAHWS